MPDTSKSVALKNTEPSFLIREIYRRLFSEYGPQDWWPGETPFEVMIGAILTQSCSWQNVEKSITNLKGVGLMSPPALRGTSTEELARLIHSCGYYNVKARKLKALADWLGRYCSDNIEALSKIETTILRQELLSVYCIGEETADSILLYACDKPVFVIDTYTKRIIKRTGIASDLNKYNEFQQLFTHNLTSDVPMFNEYHALLVRLGKETCRKIPRCSNCCLCDICLSSKEIANNPSILGKV